MSDINNILRTVGIFNDMVIREIQKEYAKTDKKESPNYKLDEELEEIIRLKEKINRIEDLRNRDAKVIERNLKDFNNVFTRNQSLQKENEEIQNLNQQLIIAKNLVIQKNNDLMSENADLNNKLNKSSIESEDRKVIELQTKIAQLQYQLTESLSNSTKWKNEVENKDWELKEVQHDLDKYKKSDKELREQNIEVKEINNSLFCQLNDLKNKSNKLEECSKGIDEHLVKTEDDLSEALKEINQLKNIISYGATENESLIKRNSNLVDNSTRLFNENVALKKAIEVLNERNNNQSDTIKKLDNEVRGLEKQNDEINIIKEKATNILYKKSSEVFGNKHIFEQTIEEMAELMVEINKVRRVNEGFDLTKINNLPQIMEEVCDVQMCLNHLKILFNETDFKNIQVKKFNKFADHFKRQFNKKQNEEKLNDLMNNPETKNHVFIPLDINEDQLFAESVNGCP